MNEILHPVNIFSATHFTFLAILWPVAVLLAVFLSKRYGYSRKIVMICAVIGILCELEKIFFFIERSPYGYGYRLPPNHLPFAMCPFQIFLIFSLAFSTSLRKRRPLLSFMYPMLVGGGAVGMLLQYTYHFHGLLDFATYRFFLYHTMLIFLGFYLYMSQPIRFTIREYGMAIGLGMVAVIFAIWVNGFFGWNPQVNFLFVVRPPREGIPLLNLDRGWAIYIGQIAWIAVAVFTLCYIREIKRDLPELFRTLRAKFGQGKQAVL